jgi:hypothetical protein
MPVVTVTPRIALSRTNTATDALTEAWGVTASYHVVATAGTTEAEVLAHADIPKIRNQYGGAQWLRVVNVTASRTSPLLWEVQVQYQTPQGAGGGGAQSPLLTPPKIKYGSEVTTEDIDTDVDGKAILMVTTEEPNPRITREFHTPLIHIQRNVLWVNSSIIADYRMVTNADTWYGNPPGTCLIRSLEAENVPDADFDYWVVNASIAIRRGAPNTTDDKAWHVRRLAQGFLENVPDPVGGPDLKGVTATKNGKPVAKPVLHDITDGFLINNPLNAEWYEWKIYESKPFSELGLI